MLFPWARYVVGAKKLNLRKIAPTWPQVSERSWIRNETDKRWYGNLFRVMPDEITGPPRLWNLGTLNRRPEEEAWKFARDGRSVILFSGIKDYFNNVLNEHTTVREALLQLTNPKLLLLSPKVTALPSPFMFVWAILSHPKLLPPWCTTQEFRWIGTCV